MLQNHEKFNLLVSKCIVVWFIKLPESLHSFWYILEYITKEDTTCFHETRNHKTAENRSLMKPVNRAGRYKVSVSLKKNQRLVINYRGCLRLLDSFSVLRRKKSLTSSSSGVF